MKKNSFLLILGCALLAWTSAVSANETCAENVCSVGAPSEKAMCGCPNSGGDRPNSVTSNADEILDFLKQQNSAGQLSPAQVKKLKAALADINNMDRVEVVSIPQETTMNVLTGRMSCSELFQEKKINCSNLDTTSPLMAACECGQPELIGNLTGRNGECVIEPGSSRALCDGDEYELVGSSQLSGETSRRRTIALDSSGFTPSADSYSDTYSGSGGQER